MKPIANSMDNTTVTLKLREKPLRNGSRALILDYYIGASGEKNSRVDGQRFRQHMGLYLSDDNSPESKVENEKILLKANKILAAKKKEIMAQLKMNPTSVPNLTSKENNSDNRLKTYSVRLQRKALKNNTESLYLAFNIGNHEVTFENTLITGRQKLFLSLYLVPITCEEDIILNQKTLSKARNLLTKAVISVEKVLKSCTDERNVLKSNLNEL